VDNLALDNPTQQVDKFGQRATNFSALRPAGEKVT